MVLSKTAPPQPSRHTSPSHGTGEWQPQSENECKRWLFLERACCMISSDFHMKEDHKRPRRFGFRTFFSSARTTQAHTNLRELQYISTYRKRKRTAFNRPCREQQSSYGSTFRSTIARQRKQASMKEQARCCREPLYEYYMFQSFLFECCFFFVCT